MQVLRNAIDHGLEPAAERSHAGKSPLGKLRLGSHVEGDECVIEVADDGRGIDWKRVAEIAAQRGLPHASHDDLVAALFVDGLSTREEVSDSSGRGVGMGAMQAACRALSGRIEVISAAGYGTTLRFRVPLAAAGKGTRKVA